MNKQPCQSGGEAVFLLIQPYCKWKSSRVRKQNEERINTPRFVGKDGFEPPKSKDSRFTVCPIWPLWNLPKWPFC